MRPTPEDLEWAKKVGRLEVLVEAQRDLIRHMVARENTPEYEEKLQDLRNKVAAAKILVDMHL